MRLILSQMLSELTSFDLQLLNEHLYVAIYGERGEINNLITALKVGGGEIVLKTIGGRHFVHLWVDIQCNTSLL